MSYSLKGFTHTAPLGATPIGYGYGVDIDAAGNAVLPSAGGSIVGVSQDKQTVAGQALAYQFSAIAEVMAGTGGIAIRDFLKVAADGTFVTATTAEVLAGKAVGRCLEAAAVGVLGTAFLFIGGASLGAGVGFDDIVLGTTAPSNITHTTFVQTTGTKTGVLAAGITPGQGKRVIQSVAAATPVGTITGTFLTLAGAAATTLALGTAVGTIVDLTWTGTAWRATSAIGGTGASLS